MSPRIRRVAVFVGATGLLATAAGCGGTAATSSPSRAQGAAGQSQSQQQEPGAGAPDLSALADKLGVTTAKLQQAMQAARPSAPGAGGQSATDPAAALAKALGLPLAKVQAAMQATRPSGAPQAPPDGQAPAGQAPAGQTAA